MTTVEQLIDMTEVEIIEYFENSNASMLEIFNIWKTIWYIKGQEALVKMHIEKLTND